MMFCGFKSWTDHTTTAVTKNDHLPAVASKSVLVHEVVAVHESKCLNNFDCLK